MRISWELRSFMDYPSSGHQEKRQGESSAYKERVRHNTGLNTINLQRLAMRRAHQKSMTLILLYSLTKQCGGAGAGDTHLHKVSHMIVSLVKHHDTVLLSPAEQLVTGPF